MGWRDDKIYKVMTRIIEDAGVRIYYEPVPERADGVVWARAEGDRIMMPDDDRAFADPERACLILGREMGRILSHDDRLDGIGHDKTEAVCELIGAELYRLAARTAVTGD